MEDALTREWLTKECWGYKVDGKPRNGWNENGGGKKGWDYDSFQEGWKVQMKLSETNFLYYKSWIVNL